MNSRHFKFAFSLIVLGLVASVILAETFNFDEESYVYLENISEGNIPIRTGPNVNSSGVGTSRVEAGQAIRLYRIAKDSDGNRWIQIGEVPGVDCPDDPNAGCWVAQTYNNVDRFKQVPQPLPRGFSNPFPLDGQDQKGCLPLQNLHIFRDIGDLDFRYKDEDELYDWIACYTNELTNTEFSKIFDPETGDLKPNGENHFKGLVLFDELRDELKAASDATGIPVALLTCQAWIESRFDAKSGTVKTDAGLSRCPTGMACGLSQFEVGHINTIDRVFSSRRDTPESRTEKLRELLANPPKRSSDKWNRFEVNKKTGEVKSYPEVVDYVYNRALNSSRRDILRPEWKKYVEAVKQNPGLYEGYAGMLDADKFCDGKCDNFEYSNPVWAVGAMAIALKDYMMTYDIRFHFDKVPTESDAPVFEMLLEYDNLSSEDAKKIRENRERMSPTDFLLFSTAVYNAGENHEVLRKLMLHGGNVQEWLTYLESFPNNSKYKEVASHMRSIHECMQQGNFSKSGENPTPRCNR